jgi:hypothetical protein
MDFSGWSDNQRIIERFLCGQFPSIRYSKPKQTVRT